MVGIRILAPPAGAPPAPLIGVEPGGSSVRLPAVKNYSQTVLDVLALLNLSTQVASGPIMASYLSTMKHGW